MQPDRFFQSTRGKIVEALQRRRSASAVDLASELGLSPNAIRQHLVVLERDGLVSERAVRRGRTKPTLEFSLTDEAARLFPQRYDVLLNAVLREVRETAGDAGVRAIFDGMAKRSSARMQEQLGEANGVERVEAFATALRERGIAVDVDLTGETVELREHACPYASTVKEHPEVCSVMHGVLTDVFPAGSHQVESLATGGNACRFEIKA